MTNNNNNNNNNNYNYNNNDKHNNDKYNKELPSSNILTSKLQSPLFEVLKQIENTVAKNDYRTDINNQIAIEEACLNYFNISGYNIEDINSNVLNPVISKYILERSDLLDLYISNFIKSLHENKNVKYNKFMLLIMIKLDRVFFINICIYYFLSVLTYQATDLERDIQIHVNLVGSFVNLGKILTRRYLRKVMILEFEGKLKKDRLSYTNWLTTWEAKNNSFAKLLDKDDFYSFLGIKIIEILENSNFINKELVKTDRGYEDRYELRISEKELIKSTKKKSFIIHTNLPMIVKPNEYNYNILGGYLLNDVYYKESLFIKKKAYKVESELNKNNKIYSLVNNINSTPFKINIELLEYITREDKHILLIDPSEDHEYEDLSKLTKYQANQLKSHKSKLLLQEIILDLANFYKNFKEIYFPVRLDQRGRLYCLPSYLNYQSTELAKALIMFANPGKIKTIKG